MPELDDLVLYGIITFQAIVWYRGLRDSYELSRFLKRETSSEEKTLEEALRQDIYN